MSLQRLLLADFRDRIKSGSLERTRASNERPAVCPQSLSQFALLIE